MSARRRTWLLLGLGLAALALLNASWFVSSAWITVLALICFAGVAVELFRERHFEAELRQQAEAALREAGEFNAQVIASAAEGIIVYDRDLRYRVWNPVMVRMSGKTEAEVLGRHPLELFPYLREHGRYEALLRALKGESVVIADIRNVNPVTGQVVWTAPRVSPLYNSRGDVVGVINSIRDVTDQRLAQEALRESEEKYRTLIETTDTGFVVLDGAGRVVDANAEYVRLTGRRSLEEIRGRGVTEWTAEHDRERNAAEVARCAALGFVRNLEIDYTDGRGGRPVEINATVIKTTEGERILALCRDISGRKRAEAKLHEYNERLQELSRRLLEAQESERRRVARELHDEIGQVLTAVKINLQTLRRIVRPETPLPRLDDSIAITDRALQQVRTLALDLRPSILDDLGLVAALRWFLDRQGQRAGFRGQVRAEPPDLVVPGDLATTCFRITQEAVTNAVRHAHAATITVELRREKGDLYLVVRDDGPGFDVAGARQRGERGASLGLVGMQERASLAGGTIEVTSGPGRGTEVRARFPLPKPAAAPDARDPQP